MAQENKSRLKAVIVDDEQNGIEFLQYSLERNCPEVEVCGTFNLPLEALESIPELKPDILFVDVEMPRMNGFELVERLSYPGLHIIFTTAYNEFALKAFRVSATDYLLKPIDTEELKQAVQKVIALTREDNTPVQELLDYIRGQKNIKKISVSTDKGIYFLEPDEIIYLQSEGSYTHFFLSGDRKILSSRPIGEYEEMLGERGFFRIHHSSIINVQHLNKYIRQDGGYVEMSNGSTLTVSRRKKDEFLGFLSK
ncbi:MAG: response regulator transcription factor [Bacteroidetes bacterium]|nr:response regulator transcription factor [Bacteroidota bacterium]